MTPPRSCQSLVLLLLHINLSVATNHTVHCKEWTVFGMNDSFITVEVIQQNVSHCITCKCWGQPLLQSLLKYSFFSFSDVTWGWENFSLLFLANILHFLEQMPPSTHNKNGRGWCQGTNIMRHLNSKETTKKRGPLCKLCNKCLSICSYWCLFPSGSSSKGDGHSRNK